ncbi:transcription factor A, mitochondrial-like isoform X1 [Dreissena polymorpha]|uniref:transcription factor A, mitochondrial-like isoform X1 n=1 Tax=Dreissena polymorpha TaxID=45954 RepID=UPI0022644AE0|nr:transcription factor A, mitochondrial-like isoform X1 [Dreissena polymorpha]
MAAPMLKSLFLRKCLRLQTRSSQLTLYCGRLTSTQVMNYDSGRPKKPRNEYFVFLSEMSPQIKEENPNFTRKQTCKRASELYRNLSESELEYYKQKANFDEKLKEWKESLSDTDIKKMKDDWTERQKRKSLSMLKKEWKNNLKPERPFPSFTMYLIEEKTKNPTKPFHTIIQECRIKWNEVRFKQQKQAYFCSHKEQLEVYYINTKEWEARMVAEGKAHLVPNKSRGQFRNKLNNLGVKWHKK